MIEDKDITFITNTLFSVWLRKCKELVSGHFPESKHVIIDCTVNWPSAWFNFLDYLPTMQSKYFALIDEDCYILNKNEVLQAVQTLEQENATLIGAPDDFYTIRNFNGIALNPFFMIGDRERLLNAISRVPNWTRLKYKKEYLKTTKLPSTYSPPEPNYEVFYCLFWAILEAGEKLCYLQPVNSFDSSTTVCLESGRPGMCIHAWYSRKNNLEKYQSFVKNYKGLQNEEKLL